MMEELHEGEFCPQCLIEYILEHKDMLLEAEYKGRKVPLGKPMAGDVKKFKVFVKNKKGNIVKVNFGQKGVKIKKNNPKRRKSFRARHKCHTAKDRTTARYWSCRKW
jgi:aryl-phospho-beta-D-glucosidase BglC (GH1 family)